MFIRRRQRVEKHPADDPHLGHTWYERIDESKDLYWDLEIRDFQRWADHWLTNTDSSSEDEVGGSPT